VKLTFASFGGVYQDAQRKAWLDPYSAATGVEFTNDENSSNATIKAQVEAGQVTWDVVDVGNDFGLDANKDLLEPLDYTLIPRDEVLDGFAGDYRVADITYGVVLGYNTDKTAGKVPAGWADFFDLQKFPGKRGLWKNPFGNLADQKIFSADVYLNFPQGEDAELVLEATGYLNRNGSGSANTGIGFFADVGYRFTFVAPYVSYSYFNSDDCADLTLSPAQLTTCNATIHTADSRNFKAGLNFFFNKNLNHLNLEFQLNHGLSSYGPQAITAANAGYAPAGINNTLRISAQKSFLAHWNVLF